MSDTNWVHFQIIVFVCPFVKTQMKQRLANCICHFVAVECQHLSKTSRVSVTFELVRESQIVFLT
jgi:hypothetical protein